MMADIKSIADLTPDEENARRHNERNVGMIVNALQEVGAARSIVIDEDGLILAGNATVEAAALAGIEWVRVVEADGETIVAVRRTGLTPEAKKRLAYFDNRTSELADWNPDQLLADLEGGLDLSGLFGKAELDELLKGLAPEPPEDLGLQIDKAAELQEKWGTAIRQIWQLGEHRLAVGDCTDRAVVDAVMKGEKTDLLWTDPPFKRDYQSRGLKGNVSKFGDWENICKAIVQFCNSINTWYVKISWREIPDLSPLIMPDDCIIWAKRGFGLGRADFRSQHEILLYRNQGKPCKAGNDIGNVWEVSVPFRGRMWHVAETPCDLIERAIGFSSDGGDIVVDPFIGSGTTLIACERLNRRCRAIEIEPKYCAVTIQRWVDLTNGEPQLIE